MEGGGVSVIKELVIIKRAVVNYDVMSKERESDGRRKVVPAYILKIWARTAFKIRLILRVLRMHQIKLSLLVRS